MPVWVVLQCLFLFFAFLFVLFSFVVSFRKEDESFQSRMNCLYSSPWPIWSACCTFVSFWSFFNNSSSFWSFYFSFEESCISLWALAVFFVQFNISLCCFYACGRAAGRLCCYCPAFSINLTTAGAKTSCSCFPITYAAAWKVFLHTCVLCKMIISCMLMHTWGLCLIINIQITEATNSASPATLSFRC